MKNIEQKDWHPCVNRASLRHLGAPCRPLIWCPLKLISFKFFQPRTWLANIFVDTYPNCRWFSEKFFCMWKTWDYRHHIALWLFQWHLSTASKLAPWAPPQPVHPLDRPYAWIMMDCENNMSFMDV